MIKWFYKGISIRQYCNIYGLSYSNLYYHLKKVDTINDEVIFNIIKEQEQKSKQNQIKLAIKQTIENDDIKIYQNALIKLKINKRHATYLYNKGYSYKKIIILSWFYYDKQNSNNEKILSLKKLKYLISKQYLQNNKTLLDIVVFSMLKNKIAQEELYNLVYPYFNAIIKKELQTSNIPPMIEIKNDIMSFSFSYLLDILPNIYLMNQQQIGKYISISIKWRIHDYIRAEYITPNISLDSFEPLVIEKIMYQRTQSNNPLDILINQEILVKVKQAFHNLDLEEKNQIYNLYFSTTSILDIELILNNIISGSEICPALEKFQKRFLELYGNEEVCNI